MMNYHDLPKRIARWGVLACCLLVSNAWSDDAAQSKERQALRRAQQQMQQLKQDKQAVDDKLAVLDKEKTELLTDKEKSVRQLSSALGKAKAESAHGQQLQAALDALQQAKASVEMQKKELDTRLEEQLQKQQETERQLQLTRDDKKRLEEQLHANELQLADRDAKNFSLYKQGRELIDQCRDKSASDVFLRLEPFTRIRGVEMENQLEQYRDRLDQERRSAASTGLSTSAQ